MPLQYPLSAIVPSHADDRDDMTLALVLTTISPEVGGVLVRGEKGTAKSTTVRALASVLPPIEVVAGDRFSSRPGDVSPDGPGTATLPSLASAEAFRLSAVLIGRASVVRSNSAAFILL